MAAAKRQHLAPKRACLRFLFCCPTQPARASRYRYRHLHDAVRERCFYCLRHLLHCTPCDLSGIHFPSLLAETITAGLDQAEAYTSATPAHSTTEQRDRQYRNYRDRRSPIMANSLEAKIVVLGSQGVGKTSFVHRYVKNAFAPPSTQSTIGASFLTKRVIDVDTSTVVRLQIWDTAGQERFRSISKLYYRGMSPSMQSH